MGRGSTTPVVTALIGGLAMFAGLLAPWIEVGFGTGESAMGVDLLSCWLPIGLASMAVVACALLWYFGSGEGFGTAVMVAAAFGFAFSGATLLVVEGSSDLLPSALIPATFRRSSGVAAAGIGIWLTLMGSAVALVAVVGGPPSRFDARAWSRRNGTREVAATILLLVLTVLVAWLRYEPWVQSSVLGRRFAIHGQAVPWLGPGSLAELVPLGGALLLAAFSRFTAAGLLAAAGGWVVTFLAAMAMIVVQAVPGLHLDDLVRAAGSDGEVTVHSAIAVWGTYVSGLAIAGVGGFLVFCAYRSGGG